MTTKYETPGLAASVVLMALHLPTGLGHTVGELRYQGRSSGRHIALPVSMVRTDDGVVVRVGNAATKTWWRNFRSEHPVSVRIDGEWLTGVGHLVSPGSIEHEQVEAVYQRAHPRMQSAPMDPYVVIDVGPRAEVPAPQRLRRQWFWRVTLGEFVGFSAPALGGTLVAHAGAVATIVTMLLAGVIEGSVLGRFQAGVLRTTLSRLRIRDWVLATAGGATVAWSIGVLPMLLGERFGDWPLWVRVPSIALGALIVVFSLGVAQWTVLRRFTDRAVLWIWGTAVAWIAGLTAFALVTTPLWQPGQSTPLIVAIGILGGLVMAAVMAAVSGAFLTRVLAAGHVRHNR